MFKFLIILPSLLLKKTVYFFRFRSAILPKRKTLSTRNMSPAEDDIVSDHDRKFIELRKECVTKSWLNKSLAGRIVVNLMRMNTKRVEVDFVCKSFSCSWIRLPINKCSWISNWMEINARIFILHIIFRRRVPTEIQNWLEFSVKILRWQNECHENECVKFSWFGECEVGTTWSEISRCRMKIPSFMPSLRSKIE